jgi:DNA primase
LRGLAFEALALKLASDLPEPAAEQDSASGGDRGSLQELRSVLNGLLIERLEQQKSEAIAAMANDPSALKRYQELDLQWRQLKNPKV